MARRARKIIRARGAAVPVLRMNGEEEYQLFHRAVRYWTGQRKPGGTVPNTHKIAHDPRDEQILEYARQLVSCGIQ